MNPLFLILELAKKMNSMKSEIELGSEKVASIMAIDIEVEASFFVSLESEFKFFDYPYYKYIKPSVELSNGRHKGYWRVIIDGFTFNIYHKQDIEEVIIKYKKPFSRFY